uniref:palmitoyl-protein hydrolase n=2 Tax=Coturnix japonica TaxID=93934 RepID=A0A8C2TDA6_COTJA
MRGVGRGRGCIPLCAPHPPHSQPFGGSCVEPRGVWAALTFLSLEPVPKLAENSRFFFSLFPSLPLSPPFLTLGALCSSCTRVLWGPRQHHVCVCVYLGGGMRGRAVCAAVCAPNPAVLTSLCSAGSCAWAGLLGRCWRMGLMQGGLNRNVGVSKALARCNPRLVDVICVLLLLAGCLQAHGWRPPRPLRDCRLPHTSGCRGKEGASQHCFGSCLAPSTASIMNGLSISQLCWLFCCPPCPSRIAAKLAFLPPEPTYAVVPEPEPIGSTSTGSLRGGAAGRWKLHLKDRADFQYSQRELDNIEVFVTKSSRGNRIGCMYVRCVPGARYTVLFSHGNAVDLGQMCSFYIGLGSRINCNVFSYDYSGYGASTGKPSERNLYSDIDAAWQALRTRYGISPENIILYGQSIGTVPTVDLASRYECAAIVLHSPLTSGMRVAFPETKKTYWFDAFPNIEKISKITSPVLIIHGTEDEVIDFSHGLALFERCPKAVEPLWVDGAGHNDIELYSQYLERLRKFISQELASQCN